MTGIQHCPLCNREFATNIIEEHASNCVGVVEEPQFVDLGPEKHPSETYSQYYSRIGCKKVAQKPIKLEVPDHLK